MPNTLTEYKQMHNKTISWNENWILIFICFVGRLLLDPLASSSSSFIIASFLIQKAKVDKKFFKSWVLHIPHWLRDLLLDGDILMFNCTPLLFSSYDSSFFFFPKFVESNHFLLEHIPWMNSTILGGHSRWPSSLLHSSLFLLQLQVVLDLRDSYDCMVSAF